MALGETSRSLEEQAYGVSQKTHAEQLAGRSLTEQQQEQLSNGVNNFRQFYLESLAKSNLSSNESKTFDYKETDGHWEAIGTIPSNKEGTIYATFSVGLKSRPNQDGVHEPYAMISFPHDKDAQGNVKKLDGDPDAIRETYINVGYFLGAPPTEIHAVLEKSGLGDLTPPKHN